MSSYGTPPPNPYGGPSYDPNYGRQPTYQYAGWFTRVLAYLVDSLFNVVPVIIVVVGIVVAVSGLSTYTDAQGVTHTTGDVNPSGLLIAVVGALLSLALGIYNLIIRQGRTGQTFGKTALGIRLVGESTGQPIGIGLTFVRQLAHFVDGLCYIGYLWPLWDAKKQTFADKIMSTVVVKA